jgi:PAS domain S-box-containing protein
MREWIAVLVAGSLMAALHRWFVRRRARLIAEARREAEGREAQLRSLMEAVPSPVFFKDTRGRYIECNAASARFLGLRREQIIGHTLTETMPPEAVARYRALDESLLSGGGPQIHETAFPGPEGLRHIGNRCTERCLMTASA